jgi:hypothetical protein
MEREQAQAVRDRQAFADDQRVLQRGGSLSGSRGILGKLVGLVLIVAIAVFAYKYMPRSLAGWNALMSGEATPHHNPPARVR